MRLFRRREPDLRTRVETASVRDVDLLVWMGGEPGRTGEALAVTLESLREQLPDACVTFLADGPDWEGMLRIWAPRFPNRREIRLRQATDRPAVLYEMGMAGSVHPWVAFLWPGCGVSAEGLRRLRGAADESGADLVYGDLAAPPAELFHPVQPGWLRMADLVPMHNALLARKVELGFDGSPRAQRTFWWDFTLRLSRAGRMVHAPVPAPPAVWSWRDFPLKEKAELVAGGTPAVPGGAPLKVVLLSGLLDAHQNQLFFYNFFDRVGNGISWRTMLYEQCRAADLSGCDLVVFSRPRFPAVPALLDRCRAEGIPALVMIDDNWIAAGREYPRFERLFTPGRPPFEIFLDALRRADATLVFNPVLEEEVRPWARRVLRLPPNVDLSLFAPPDTRREPGFVAGFAGSPRFEESGFRGLARFLARRLEARLLVMAHEVPAPLQDVAPERLTFIPWRHDYATYARTLAAERPDVLVAPLDASRFSASKIPIKLLESAAVGAAGIYSRVLPYTEHVTDGETGLLVENREEAWAEALERLYTDPELRGRLAANAGRLVRERFATERVLPAFLDMLRNVIDAKEPG